VGLLKTIGIVLVVIFLVVVLALGAMGFVPGVSDLMGTNKPRDLGVRYTEADYDSLLAKLPGMTIENMEDVCLGCPHKVSGSVPADAVVSQEEFSALLNKGNKKSGLVKDIQVRFNSDGTVEASGTAVDPRLSGPIYAKAKPTVCGPRCLTFEMDSAEAGRVGVSGDQLKTAQDLLNQVSEGFFDRNPGLSVESLSIEGGKMNFKGTVPEKVEGIPGSVPQPIG